MSISIAEQKLKYVQCYRCGKYYPCDLQPCFGISCSECIVKDEKGLVPTCTCYNEYDGERFDKDDAVELYAHVVRKLLIRTQQLEQENILLIKDNKELTDKLKSLRTSFGKHVF